MYATSNPLEEEGDRNVGFVLFFRSLLKFSPFSRQSCQWELPLAVTTGNRKESQTKGADPRWPSKRPQLAMWFFSSSFFLPRLQPGLEWYSSYMTRHGTEIFSSSLPRLFPSYLTWERAATLRVFWWNENQTNSLDAKLIEKPQASEDNKKRLTEVTQMGQSFGREKRQAWLWFDSAL